MTESCEDGNYLVRVRAQVMIRDDSTGGWVPMGGGGLSNVSVRKRVITSEHSEETKHEYLIYGKRISDQAIILSCVIKKDFEYNKVMPTFHHWKTGDKKFGLTFQTAADARAFDKGVRTAVEELLDGLAAQYQKLFQQKHIEDVGDDDVFMTLNLPVERGDSRSSSDSSTGKTPPIRKTPPPQPLSIGKAPAQLPTGKSTPPFVKPKALPTPPSQTKPLPQPPGSEEPPVGGYSYIQLTTVHEYLYPLMEEGKGNIGQRRDSGGSLKKRSPSAQGLSSKSGGSGGRRKETCRHCQEPFCADNNVRGSCEYAPDCVKSSINTVACISCAQCMLYHCMSDPEGDFGQHPCECGPVDESCSKRWIGLALLSLIVPCLWCYPPLRACHWCCVSCGLCGGKHTPAN
ncbi:sprouty-related, EVH1 domain-containing protein 2 isoform X1 [Halyomorpha halys]|uniref:sprouty-related, EVH1 domain-containing protein 2 isoform X1 n=2 Tax=Halyomorpha halys TaxID=286706 RepID=UPI0006D51550|nr:sprouty-related, EVH1 domain-containing protein 1 isoform X1 [Halyomorpha halys]